MAGDAVHIERAFDRDRPLRARARLLTALACGLAAGTIYGTYRLLAIVEDYDANGYGVTVGRFLASVSGVVGASVAEIAVGLAALFAIFRVGLAIVHVAAGRRRVRNVLACGGLQIVAAASVLIALFYATWGLNYTRPDVVERLHWTESAAAPTAGEAAAGELPRLCEGLVDATNRSYEQAHQASDLGRPSTLPRDVVWIDSAIEAGYEHVAKSLGLAESFAMSRGPAKPVFASSLMSLLGISGMYCPFTGEANYNRLVPASELPQVLGHEKAHQRCIACEDEASFFGFLACARSDDAYVRYSGYLFAERQLLRELERSDPEQTRALVARRLAGVQRDVDASNEFWKRQRGVLSDIGREVNDRYLKLNRVKGGVESYARCARLLTIFSRTNAGTCVISN